MPGAFVTITQCITVTWIFQACLVIKYIGSVSPNAYDNHPRFKITGPIVNEVTVGIFVAFAVIDPDAHTIFAAQQVVNSIAAKELSTGETIRLIALLFFTLFEARGTRTGIVAA